MDKHSKYNKYVKFFLVLIAISAIIGIAIISILIYRAYKNVDSFISDDNINNINKINKINNLNISSDANKILTNNDYVGLMSDSYNKMILQDEDSIQKLYKDAIVKSNIIAELNSINNNQIKSTYKKFPAESLIKTIKSKNNAQMLSLISNDPSGKYSVNVNDKCLTVSGTCENNTPYCIQDCQNILYTSDSQKFSPVTIASAADAKKIMGLGANINSANVYPFNAIISAVDNTCLAMSNSGVTLEQCNLNDIRHQWSVSPDENICLTE